MSTGCRLESRSGSDAGCCRPHDGKINVKTHIHSTTHSHSHGRTFTLHDTQIPPPPHTHTHTQTHTHHTHHTQSTLEMYHQRTYTSDVRAPSVDGRLAVSWLDCSSRCLHSTTTAMHAPRPTATRHATSGGSGEERRDPHSPKGSEIADSRGKLASELVVVKLQPPV